MNNIGANQFRVLATNVHALLCWVWRLVRMAQIEPGECLPETAAVKGCFAQGIVPGLQTRQVRTIAMMG